MENTFVVADTGFIVALLNQKDIHHLSVRQLYLQQEQILLPQTVLAETAYLIGRESGISIVIQFLKGISQSKFIPVCLNEFDIQRVAEILQIYESSRIDFVDATVMAIAERFNIRLILTIDQRDFRLFKPKHCPYFEILP